MWSAAEADTRMTMPVRVYNFPAGKLCQGKSGLFLLLPPKAAGEAAEFSWSLGTCSSTQGVMAQMVFR